MEIGKFALAAVVVYAGFYAVESIDTRLGTLYVIIILLSIALIYRDTINKELKELGLL
jgi:hypothetical protein